MPNVPTWKWCSNKPEGKCWLRMNSKILWREWTLAAAIRCIQLSKRSVWHSGFQPMAWAYRVQGRRNSSLMRTGQLLLWRNRLYYYTQYHLHIQLLDAGNYAREKVLSLKVISLSASAATAWRHGLSRIISTWTVRQAHHPTHSPWTDKTGAFPPIIGR